MEPPAIFFHPDAIETKGKELVGRRSAGQSFLHGFLEHSPGDHINAVTETAEAAKAFETVARDLGETRPLRVDPIRGGNFTRSGAIFFPGPGFLNAAWARQRHGAEKCSLIGVTHTVSTRRVVEGFHQTLNEPVEDWDAVICTSRAVHSVVARQFELEADFMRRRYGATRVPQPQLPILPLGIRTRDFARSDDLRAEARAKFGAPEDAIVILTMGRWTVVEKANPVPLFLILEELAQSLGKPVHLWMAGWASREEEERIHRDGAAAICPSVTTRMIDGRDPFVRRAIWSGADIFTLPVDNIQETFGLVPVEAMAAGLPVVMPDWDGFRDTVRDGETGFLIPTRMARPGAGDPIARRFADGTDSYIRYLLIVAQHTEIDLAAYKAALERLARDADLRARMGAAGAAHARAEFDLSRIIPRYHALAAELAERRKGARPTTPPLSDRAVSPLEVDPFDLYGVYPSQTMDPSLLIRVCRPLTRDRLALFDRFNGRDTYARRIVPDDLALRVHAQLAEAGPIAVKKLAARMSLPGPTLEAAVLLLAKFGFVAFDPPG